MAEMEAVVRLALLLVAAGTALLASGSVEIVGATTVVAGVLCAVLEVASECSRTRRRALSAPPPWTRAWIETRALALAVVAALGTAIVAPALFTIRVSTCTYDAHHLSNYFATTAATFATGVSLVALRRGGATVRGAALLALLGNGWWLIRFYRAFAGP